MFVGNETTHRMLIRHEPDIGHLFVPRQRARVPRPGGGWYTLRTNGLGFRSDVEFVGARGDRPRLLFFGDSFTAGDGVENGKRFAELAADELGAETYNYGLSGSGTDQQLLILEKFARDVEADALVLCLQVENVDRIQVGYRPATDRVSGRRVLVAKPYFSLRGGELELHHVPVSRDRPFADETQTSAWRADEIRHGGRMARLISAYRTAPQLGALRRLGARHLERVRYLLLRASGFDPYPAYASADTPGFALLEAIVRRFERSAGGRPVLLVPLPNAYYLLHGLPPRYQERLGQLASDHLRVADVTTPLRKLSHAERKGLLQSDGHYSAQGHRAVGTLVARAIREQGLVPQAAAPPRPRPSARPRGQWVLGVSCLYHNSGAALVDAGRIVAAAEEERFTRVKNDRRVPLSAINYCLEEAGIEVEDLAAIVYYDNAYLTFERLLHTLAASGERAEDAWLRILPSWLQYKLRLPQLLRERLGYRGPILQDQHHRSHAASAFLPSPFERAAILTVDGVGEWATAAIGRGEGGRVELLREMHFPHSLGMLYSAFTQFTGFKVNSGEYKMMGLAPYGEPRYVRQIYDHLVQVHDDGSLRLNLDYFAFLTEPRMTSAGFAELFGGPPREPDARITRREVDLARSIQVVTEEILLRMARHAHALTGEKKLCLSGGVALNCVANGRLLREGPFEDIWIQPAAGDSGSALGAALDVCHTWFGIPRTCAPGGRSAQGGSYLGPAYSDDEIRAFLDTHGFPYTVLGTEERPQAVAALLDQGKVVGHFDGRVEFGPRALGSRSILGDARNPDTQATLNLKIKYRESFRPFAPAVLSDQVSKYFELDRESPYMLIVAPVRPERCLPVDHRGGEDLTQIVREARSDLPAITHVDYSARIQTVVREDHPSYYDVIRAFYDRTGCGVIVNTSFNVRGEPIVCTPFDAYRCFMRTEMDALVLGRQLLFKKDQPSWPEAGGHSEESEDATPVASPTSEDADLRRIFRERFLPAVGAFGPDLRCRLEGATGESNWVAHVPLTLEKTFQCAEDLQRDPLDPKRMAAAVVAQWQPGPSVAALTPVVEALLETQRRKPVVENPLEEVPENVYVMF